jgi:hypothetical protein
METNPGQVARSLGTTLPDIPGSTRSWDHIIYSGFQEVTNYLYTDDL